MFSRIFPSWAPVAGFLLLLSVTAVTYYPSLFHVARADQVSFLAEYAGRQDPFKTVIDSLYYNRTRQFSPGDAILFRPLLFLMLSLQRLLFGYGFFWWQLIALSAHLFTTWALWRLLRRWAGNSGGAHTAAWILTAFFSCLFTNMEAVIWHGITPYVFFAGFILLALERLEAFTASEGLDRTALNTCALWLLAAVLTYEAGLCYIVCFWLYALTMLRKTGRARQAMPLLIPLALYAAWSAGHWILSGTRVDAETITAIGIFPGLKTFVNFWGVLKWFVSGAFFLQPHDLIPISRMVVRPEVFSWSWPLHDWNAGRWAGAAALLLTIVSAGTGMFLVKNGKNLGKALLLSAMLGGYTLIIVTGRANVRLDGTGLNCSLYYFYNFWALFTALLFLLVRPLFSEKKPLAAALSAALILTAIAGSWNISRMTTDIANGHRATRQLVLQLNDFIARHQNEPGFSFYVGPDEPGNYQVSWLIRKNDPPARKYYFVEVLYPKYFNPANPKYRLGIRQ